MITCAECIERLKPDDPRIPSGRYHHSSCDYFCDKPSYYRDIERIGAEKSIPYGSSELLFLNDVDREDYERRFPKPQEQVIIHRHSNMGKQEFAELQNLKGQVKYLLAKEEAKSRKGYKYT